MTQQPFTSAALRGAVDLSGLSSRPASAAQGSAPGPRPGGGAAGGGHAADSGAVPGRRGVLVEARDETFEAVVNASLSTPLVLVLWTPQLPESLQHLRDLAATARAHGGRFQVAGVDISDNPGILQALTPMLQQVFGQISALPVVVGLLQGQPMPFYLGVQPQDQVDQLVEKFLEAAVANAVTGRVEVDGGEGPGGAAAEDEDGGAEGAVDDLPPLHQAAYDAIEQGDWDGAITAYEQALAEDASDELARLGLGHVRLLRRTSELDLAAVRQAAAADPGDVQAQLDAADVDVVGGHVEDGFLRLIELVRRSAGDDRHRARTHLLELFDVIGAHDPRVTKARQALMSALY